MTARTENILVIKLGAFGDFIQALGPMAAIRRHHPDAEITLLTTEPFVTLARDSGYCNRVWVDTRPSWTDPRGWLRLARHLRSGNFSRVYDLQNNDRTSFYFRLFGRRKPEWVGTAAGASHRNISPDRTAGHAFNGHRQTLSLAGIQDVTVDDLSWVRADASHFGLPHPFVLLVPGSTPKRPEKRWPASHFAALANHLQDQGYAPVILGTVNEEAEAKIIRRACPAAIDLCGKTSTVDLVALARAAAGAIGNDTGPMHLIAPTGCPVLVLFSGSSDPVHHAPLGPLVRTLREQDISALTVQAVLADLQTRGFRHKSGGARPD